MSRYETLREHVMLLAPSIGWWKGQYRLPKGKVRVELSGSEVTTGKITTPQAILITDTYPYCSYMGDRVPWKKRLQTIESNQRALIEIQSTVFPIRGVRMIPVNCVEDFLEKTESNSAAMAAAGEEFVDNFDRILAEIREHTDPNVWREIGGRWPQPESLRAKFYLNITPVELASQTRIQSINHLQQHNQMIQDSIHQKVEEAIEELVREPREKLAEALAGLSELIARNGRVTSASFNSVRDAITKIRNFDFVADSILLTKIEELETRMGVTVARELTPTTAATSGFQAALDSVRAEVENADAAAEEINRFGRPLRSIAS